MQHLPKNLVRLIEQRRRENAFRELSGGNERVDFSSNDYLGFSKSVAIAKGVHKKLQETVNGATGSRLLTGNHELHSQCEQLIAAFHYSEASLLFNSGYDANLGIFSSIPQRGDIILYDELCHASIRDGIRMSHAKAYKFAHNDIEDLSALLQKHRLAATNIYIATESVFSMDGDTPDLANLAAVAEKHNAYIIIDEAHGLGVFGENGEGLVQSLQLQNHFFIRLMTFGKGLGCHGAAVVCKQEVRDYLINFARSFIYTTALPPHAVATIATAYNQLKLTDQVEKLRENILFFNEEKTRLGIKSLFVRSKSAIQSAIVPGNGKVKAISEDLQQNGYDVRPILSPTVPSGQERLRICLHSFNTKEQISEVLRLLTTAVSRA